MNTITKTVTASDRNQSAPTVAPLGSQRVKRCRTVPRWIATWALRCLMVIIPVSLAIGPALGAMAPGTWTLTGSMVNARVWHTATVLADGRVLIAGGVTGGGASATAEIYDAVMGTFSPTGSMNQARYAHAAVRLASGKVLVAGGGNGGTSAEIYDPATGTFTPTGPMAEVRLAFTATLLPSGKVLVAGGFDNPFCTPFSSTGFSQTAELLDPNANGGVG